MPTDAGRDGGGTSESKRRPGAAAVHSRAEFLQYTHKHEATAKIGVMARVFESLLDLGI